MRSPNSKLSSCLLLVPLIANGVVTGRNTKIISKSREKSDHTTHLRRQVNRRLIRDEADEGNDDCSLGMFRDGMSPTDLKRSSVAAKLSNLVYELDDDPLAAETPAFADVFDGQEERGIFYEYGIDAAFTTRIRNEYCAVAFRGTRSRYDREDMQSNFNTDPVVFDPRDSREKRKRANSDSVCEIHGGYSDSYTGFNYRSNVETFLQTCTEECPECDVLLTGHSQGGGIAEVAALYYKDTVPAPPQNLYVIVFGAPQALGAGCRTLFAKEESCRFYRYVMTMEGPLGRGLIYDPIPMIVPRALADESSDTYARYGGVAYMGHELFLNYDDSTALALSTFEGHYSVQVSKYDISTDAHDIDLYADVLDRQNQQLWSSNKGNDDKECYLPTNGFSVGSLCNRDESDLHCAAGVSECKRNGWWWGSENTCQAIDPSMTQSAAVDRFCHVRPLEWTMFP